MKNLIVRFLWWLLGILDSEEGREKQAHLRHHREIARGKRRYSWREALAENIAEQKEDTVAQLFNPKEPELWLLNLLHRANIYSIPALREVLEAYGAGTWQNRGWGKKTVNRLEEKLKEYDRRRSWE